MCLDDEIPHINLVAHPWRRLRTDSSWIHISLVGASIWATKRAVNQTHQFAFLKYCVETKCNANSASAARFFRVGKKDQWSSLTSKQQKKMNSLAYLWVLSMIILNKRTLTKTEFDISDHLALNWWLQLFKKLKWEALLLNREEIKLCDFEPS